VILLDTHAFVWFAQDPGLLGRKGRSLLARSPRRGLAAISCWEVGMLASCGRITLDRGTVDWLEDALAELAVELLPLTPSVAVRASELASAFHGDPADRMIVATALQWNATLITKDERIRAHFAERCVW
jgi:PIN domain nuclease of toxin-antitoxin system